MARSNLPMMVSIVLGTALFFVSCLGVTVFSTVGIGYVMQADADPDFEEPRAETREPLRITNQPQSVPTPPKSSASAPPTPDAAFDSSQCDDVADGGPVNGPDCATARLRCDSETIGHTRGGVDHFDTKFYEKKFCWPGTVSREGGDERIYKLTMPAGEWRAFVTLNTPCADLDVMAVRWDEATCPDMGSNIRQCEMNPSSGTTSETLELTTQTLDGREPSWYIVVEGKGEEEGPFSLHVQCWEGLGGAPR